MWCEWSESCRIGNRLSFAQQQVSPINTKHMRIYNACGFFQHLMEKPSISYTTSFPPSPKSMHGWSQSFGQAPNTKRPI